MQSFLNLFRSPSQSIVNNTRLPMSTFSQSMDMAVSTGNFEETKSLFAEHQIQPSLFAKQQAITNGFPNMYLYVDTYIKTRDGENINDTPDKMYQSIHDGTFDSLYGGRKGNILEIDKAVEYGDMDKVKKVCTGGEKPSLYAKQMALINGHVDMVAYVDTCVGTRGIVGVDTVHYKMYKGNVGWDENVPEKFRYTL